MPKRKLPEPPIAEYPFYKVILLALFVSAMLSLMSTAAAIPIRGKVMFSAADVVVGVVSFALGMLNWLSWRPRRSYTLRWISVLAGNVYISFLLLLVPLSYSHLLLNSGWSTFVNVILIGLYIMAWCIPMISSSIARRLANRQDEFSLILLKFGTPAALIVGAGILGANFGMKASMDGRVIVLAFLCSYSSIGLAQYAADHLWPYRPWAKEDE